MTLDFLLKDDETGVSYLPPIEKQVQITTTSYSEREELLARLNTAQLLQELDPQIEVHEDHKGQARAIFEAGRMPTSAEKKLPEVLIHLNALVSEYDRQVIEDATRIRNYVTNKLLEETADPDPRIRIRAYELLGKITEVGLFTERSEVTVKHKPTTELEDLIREKLSRVIDVTPVEVHDS